MSDAPPVRVLVVDDQTLVRESLTGLLGLLDGIEVVDAVGDGAEAVAATRELDPDVVLMDLVMPHLDGITATARIARESPRSRVLALTTYDDERSVAAALRAGAVGYLTKDATAEDLAQAIALAHSGVTTLDAGARQGLLRALGDGGTAPNRAGPTPPHGLTPREVAVLRAMAEGLTNAEIATRMHLSASTVKTHINNLFAKAGLSHRGQAVAYAYRHGYGPHQPATDRS